MVALGDIVAILALSLSVYATIKTLKFKKRERELIEIQKKLNLLMLEREEKEIVEGSKADIGTNFITIGKHKHRLKIFNKGKVSAYNVNINILDGKDSFYENEIQSKFPLEILERGQSVELLAAIHSDSKAKYKIMFTWKDEDGNEYEKTTYPTI